MAVRHWLTLVVALCASLAVTGAEAAAKKKGAPLVARGCTHPLAAFCLGITTTRGQTFALYNPTPWMPLRIGANVYGKAVAGGNCGAGIVVSSWKADKKIKCSDRK